MDIKRLPDAQKPGEFMTNEPANTVSFTQLNYEFPVCNYTLGIDENNLGYAKGIFDDGVPFVAELCKNGGDLSIGVIIPAVFEREYNDDPNLSEKLEGNAAPLIEVEIPKECYDNSVLDIGMTDYGQEEEFDYIAAYAEYLCDAGILEYTTNVRNASVFYRADELGNILAKVLVTIVDDGSEVAAANLIFRCFPNNKAELKIVQ